MKVKLKKPQIDQLGYVALLGREENVFYEIRKDEKNVFYILKLYFI